MVVGIQSVVVVDAVGAVVAAAVVYCSVDAAWVIGYRSCMLAAAVGY